jgi:hypothetical protein
LQKEWTLGLAEQSMTIRSFVGKSVILSSSRISDHLRPQILVRILSSLISPLSLTSLYVLTSSLLLIDAPLEDFLAWYGGMDERVDAISMQEIWEGCTPLDAKEQKPLFKAEQEAEKALGYLEGLSLTQLAAALLTSGRPDPLSLCSYLSQ